MDLHRIVLLMATDHHMCYLKSQLGKTLEFEHSPNLGDGSISCQAKKWHYFLGGWVCEKWGIVFFGGKVLGKKLVFRL